MPGLTSKASSPSGSSGSRSAPRCGSTGPPVQTSRPLSSSIGGVNSMTLAAVLPVGRFRTRPHAPSSLCSQSRMTVRRKLGSASCGIDRSRAGASFGRSGSSSSTTCRSYDGFAPAAHGARRTQTSVGEKPSDDGLRRYVSIARAARRPAPIAEMTVAPPVTMSPPAKTPAFCVAPVAVVREDVAPLVDRQVRRRVADERVGALADGEHHRVDLDVELGALDRHRAAAAGRVRLAQFHPDAADGARRATARRRGSPSARPAS